MRDSTTPPPAGYHYTAKFPGAEPTWRPSMVYLAEFLHAAYGMRVVATLTWGFIIADATYPSGGDWWTVCDNGGELNIERINNPESLRSVPYTQHGGLVQIGRLLWFCRCVLQGEEITDYFTSPLDDITLADLRDTEDEG